jgi:hypothetical protein
MDLKKMIASGTPFPLHYLAEPESTTRTTAEAAGTATFRDLEQMQTEFCDMLSALARVALEVRKRIRRGVNPNALIDIGAPDITERDNSLLALAANRIWPVLADLYDRKLMESQEFLRLVYRMAGENYDLKAPEGIRKPVEEPDENKVVNDPGDEE